MNDEKKENRFKCGICLTKFPYPFKTRLLLKNHQRTLHPKEYAEIQVVRKFRMESKRFKEKSSYI